MHFDAFLHSPRRSDEKKVHKIFIDFKMMASNSLSHFNLIFLEPQIPNFTDL